MNRPFQFIGLESWSLIPITMVGLSYPDGISQGGYFNTRLGSSTQ
ncbi:hypothetical protein An07g00960 [Aspergillus niger]|uniref:Uncharacterized protein n=2 Tax=Aspergillus niger TaxID=5061 RepID=A2QM63_ASPNC|nr:hypothetical protein An07g00960 [Aspergillus niger]CAK96544.1 hypothetical protein An07g00960 [Aspergillus niger]